MCSSGLEALSCLFSTKFLKNTDLRFITLPAIATYPLLPAGVLVHRVCKPLLLLSFTIIVCAVLDCAVAYFYFQKGRRFFLIQFCLGGADTLFGKFWLSGRLVRLGNVCCRSKEYSFQLFINRK